MLLNINHFMISTITELMYVETKETVTTQIIFVLAEQMCAFFVGNSPSCNQYPRETFLNHINNPYRWLFHNLVNSSLTKCSICRRMVLILSLYSYNN